MLKALQLHCFIYILERGIAEWSSVEHCVSVIHCSVLLPGYSQKEKNAIWAIPPVWHVNITMGSAVSQVAYRANRISMDTWSPYNSRKTTSTKKTQLHLCNILKSELTRVKGMKHPKNYPCYMATTSSITLSLKKYKIKQRRIVGESLRIQSCFSVHGLNIISFPFSPGSRHWQSLPIIDTVSSHLLLITRRNTSPDDR